MSRTKTNLKYRWQDLFPYTPRKDQVEYIEKVQEAISMGIPAIMEAKNGFGKSICNLCATLPFGKKVIYATRTHQEGLNICDEIKKINASGYKFTAVTLASRRKLCINPHLLKDEAIRRDSGLASKFCKKFFLKNGVCSFNASNGKKVEINKKMLDPQNVFKSSLGSVASIYDLTDFGNDFGYCPYYLSRSILDYAHICVMPYQYIFNEGFIDEKIIGNSIIILDESHIVPNVLKAQASKRISDYVANEALKDARQWSNNRKLEVYLDKVRYFFKRMPTQQMRKLSEKSNFIFGDIFKQILRYEGFDEKWIEEFLKMSPEAEKIQEEMIKGTPKKCHILDIMEFFSVIRHNDATASILIWNSKRHKRSIYRALEYRCLDPSMVFRRLLKRNSRIVMTSGTISPRINFQMEMGIDTAMSKEFSQITKDNARLFIFSNYHGKKLSTKWEHRKDNIMVIAYGKLIEDLLYATPGSSLVFFPSRATMDDFLTTWEHEGILDRIESRLTVFRESKEYDFEENDIPRFKDLSKIQKAVMFAVTRGIVSEGFNAPNIIKGVSVIGVPLANWTNPYVQAQIRYYDKTLGKGKGYEWYITDAIKWTNQDCGRGPRLLDDRCCFFLIDYRFATNRYLNSLSKSLHNCLVKPIRDMDIHYCKEKMRDFFAIDE
jgi:Rad3-related DNA helicase